MNAYLLRIYFDKRKIRWWTPAYDRFGHSDALVKGDTLEDAKLKFKDVFESRNPNLKVTSVVSRTIL